MENKPQDVIRQTNEVMLQVLYVLVYLYGAYYYWRYAFLPVKQACAKTNRRERCMMMWTKLANWIKTWRNRHSGMLCDAIQEHMDEFRITQCRRVIIIWAHCLSLVLPVAALMWQNGYYSVYRIPVVLMFLGMQAVLGLLIHDGRIQLTVWRLRLVYWALTVLQLRQIYIMTDDTLFFTSNTIRTLYRWGFGIAMLDHWQTVPCNIAVSIMTCWRFPANSSILLGSDSAQFAFVMQELWACALTSVGCYVVQTWLEARFRVQIIAQNQQRATLKIADYHCDALFWLTPDLHINGPAPRLARMLFILDAPDDLNGRLFETFIASDSDRTRFQEFIEVTTSTQQQGVPAAFHMHLRDATSRTFSIEVFHACFEDKNGQIGHVIGICEDGAFEGGVRHINAVEPQATGEVEQQAEQQAEEQVLPLGLPIRTPEQPMAAGEQVLESVLPSVTAAMDRNSIDEVMSIGEMSAAGSIDEFSVTSEAPPKLMPLMPDHGDGDDVSVMFNAITKEILGCTHGFASLLGPLIFKANIQEIMINKAEFAKWTLHAVNEVLNPDDGASESELAGRQIEPLDIRLRSSTVRTDEKRLEFSAKAFMIDAKEFCLVSDLCVDLKLDCADEEHEILCVVALRDTEPKWSDNKKKKKARYKRPKAGHTVTL